MCVVATKLKLKSALTLRESPLQSPVCGGIVVLMHFSVGEELFLQLTQLSRVGISAQSMMNAADLFIESMRRRNNVLVALFRLIFIQRRVLQYIFIYYC